MLATEGWRLVYGAGDVGLMGAVALSAQAAGGRTFGVIPTHLMGAEQGKRDLGTLVITEDMHERKKVMHMNSDVIVILPGGAGSLDEFFEVLTWRQLGLHAIPARHQVVDVQRRQHVQPIAEQRAGHGVAAHDVAGHVDQQQRVGIGVEEVFEGRVRQRGGAVIGRAGVHGKRVSCRRNSWARRRPRWR